MRRPSSGRSATSSPISPRKTSRAQSPSSTRQATCTYELPVLFYFFNNRARAKPCFSRCLLFCFFVGPHLRLYRCGAVRCGAVRCDAVRCGAVAARAKYSVSKAIASTLVYRMLIANAKCVANASQVKLPTVR